MITKDPAGSRNGDGLFLSPARRWIKSSLAGAAYYSGLLDCYIQLRDRCPSQNRLYILGYHAVVENVPRSVGRGMMAPQLISSKVFEKEIEQIGSQFDFLSIDQAVDFIERKINLRRDSVVITFDDGYQGVYEHAYPILKKKGIPAAVYLCSDYVGTSWLFDHDRLFYLVRKMRLAGLSLRSIRSETGLDLEMPPEDDPPLAATRFLLEKLSSGRLERLIDLLQEKLGVAGEDFPTEAKILSWEAAKEMSESGVTLGSHTASHRLLSEAEPREILEELRLSKSRLEDRLGKKVDHLAYPDGRYTPFVIDAARACGYRSACTTQDFINKVGCNPYLLGRQLFWENSNWGWRSRSSKAMVASQVKGLFKIPDRIQELPLPAASPERSELPQNTGFLGTL
ncbi:MAG TPA: polysaccharide deacetylase family protein [Candidatus Manganitrophaceae bacterium]|nr:polysaccharide deacetylase family protein [Candidatus Manganitrophaceae bacterium]